MQTESQFKTFMLLHIFCSQLEGLYIPAAVARATLHGQLKVSCHGTEWRTENSMMKVPVASQISPKHKVSLATSKYFGFFKIREI